MSALRPHSGRRRGRARARRRASGSISSGGRSRCCRASPTPRRGPCSSDDGDRTTFYAGAAPSRAPPHRDRATTATISRPARRSSGWCCGRPSADPPYRDRHASPPIRPKAKAITEAGNDIVEPVPMPEAIRETRCGVRRRAPCRADVLQAQARPRRSRRRSARRAPRARGRRMSEPENFLQRWSRRKREARSRAEDDAQRAERAGEPPQRRRGGQPTQRRPKPQDAKPDEPAFDLAEPAVARIDHRRDRHPRCSCRRACRPS